jgi:hypothetical protein
MEASRNHTLTVSQLGDIVDSCIYATMKNVKKIHFVIRSLSSQSKNEKGPDVAWNETDLIIKECEEKFVGIGDKSVP